MFMEIVSYGSMGRCNEGRGVRGNWGGMTRGGGRMGRKQGTQSHPISFKVSGFRGLTRITIYLSVDKSPSVSLSLVDVE